MTPGDPKRPRSLYLVAAERKTVRAAAAARGKSISAYVLGLAAAHARGSHPRVLTAAEQAELRDGLREAAGRLLSAEAGPAASPGTRGEAR